MKNFIIIIFILFLGSPVFPKIITGGVEYSVEDARKCVSENLQAPVDKQIIQLRLFDSDRTKHLTALLQGKTTLNDRTLAYFSDGSYGINYNNDKTRVWYYNQDGILTHTEIRTSLSYPYKSYKYSINGELVNMSLRVSKDETFIFNKSGKLLAHWIGNNCYDENNSVIMTREIFQ